MESIKDILASMAEQFNTTMKDFQQDLQKTNSPVTPSSLATEFAAFKTFVATALNSLQRQVELFTCEFDRLEMRSRRKMLLFHGVPEERSEDTSARVTNLVAEHLDIDQFSTTCIKRSYRLGRTTETKPRPIVVKFSDVSVRSKVWFAKTKFKGTGVTLSEFLTKARHDLFLATRRHFGVDKCWTRDAVIHVIAPDGSRHKIERMMDFEKIVALSNSKSAV
ncbi:uncharacterized protein LOC125071138 [Vanessa atalanta]|uniref:uncharacterized protein LOC125071138 n=1 Tax=Vanessa atalanta TaxID=42275 RepID=UPI001FCE2B8F|nr:uncharacterized protein LOC125071138 [Vanessa atalanta]